MLNKQMNPYESFYHGLVLSKIWLCENLEKIIDEHNIINPDVCILGGWHNLLSFIMLTRRPNCYNRIKSYDKDIDATKVANSICDAWVVMDIKVENICVDVYELNFENSKNTIFINCSVDQFAKLVWYNTIPKGSLVCMQTTDIVDDNTKWEINQKTKDLYELKNKYPLTNVLFEGTKNFDYPSSPYNRLMTIGIK